MQNEGFTDLFWTRLLKESCREYNQLSNKLKNTKIHWVMKEIRLFKNRHRNCHEPGQFGFFTFGRRFSLAILIRSSWNFERMIFILWGSCGLNLVILSWIEMEIQIFFFRVFLLGSLWGWEKMKFLACLLLGCCVKMNYWWVVDNILLSCFNKVTTSPCSPHPLAMCLIFVVKWCNQATNLVCF